MLGCLLFCIVMLLVLSSRWCHDQLAYNKQESLLKYCLLKYCKTKTEHTRNVYEQKCASKHKIKQGSYQKSVNWPHYLAKLKIKLIHLKRLAIENY